MAREHLAKVVGYELLEKSAGGAEPLRVKFKTYGTVKGEVVNATATIVIDANKRDDYPLGRVFNIAFELSQEELPLGDAERETKPAGKRGASASAQH